MSAATFNPAAVTYETRASESGASQHNTAASAAVFEDCCICTDGITKETGHTTMSCGHTFHFRCLTNWFCSQQDTEVSCSCPTCRHEAKDFEELPEDNSHDEDCECDECAEEEEEEEEEDDGSEAGEGEEEEENGHEIPYNPAKFKVRIVREIDEDGDEYQTTYLDGPDPIEEATKIQSLFRGFQDRRLLRRAVNFNFLPSGDLFA
jgi:hypothetical protein